MICKVAYRNIFRNKKRSFLTTILIAVCVAVILFILGYIDGITESLYSESSTMTGEIRIVNKDYDVDKKSQKLSTNIDLKKMEFLKKIDHVKYLNARISFGASIYSDNLNKNAYGIGIEKDDLNIFKLDTGLQKGYLLNYNSNDMQIMIGQGLQKKLKAKVGDSITIMSNTQYDSISAFNFELCGVFQAQNNIMNNMFFIKLNDCQYLLDMDGYALEYAIYSKKREYIKNIAENIAKKIDKNDYIVQRWDEIGYGASFKKTMAIFRFIIIGLFGILAGAGITNTVMMIIFERKKEFGILESNGMKKKEVFLMLLWESILIGFVGSVIGVIFAAPITYYFSINGIDFGKVAKDVFDTMNISNIIFLSFNLKIVIYSIFTGLFFTILSTFIPFISLYFKNPAELLRN